MTSSTRLPLHPSPRLATMILGAAVVGALLPATTALAHPGHGSAGISSGLLHPLPGTDHLLAMVAIGMVAALSASRRIAVLTPAAFVGGMVLGAVLGMSGIGLPGVEMVIALSLVTLGTVTAVAMRRDTLLLPAAALAFGIAHGHAHGAELPASASPATYAIGFLLATVALHASGAAFGRILRHSPGIRVAIGTLVATTGLTLLVGL